ncbi:hypothetical protein CC85DRAFT_330383 [Cutaneotrichosporon oleaginosum]|uniref:Ubiquitin-like domain-containing protein n=1 Tax=Cutaneotrichosporon oleaginosum TaxID=879819 RepID=A0A0J0XFK0_9TREE|nr:uncharacterized protein CC85DRAFT_330383 [Cutaneotrichosporon oleaginosum]KLT39847.1 hypothetical protein CC85DRAFT_330383 [Cutaneotrichosporon oleaginosum]TXT05444.1 hypothetical protein COLE_06764 [Cutaneotrichosporon oleaginosum]
MSAMGDSQTREKALPPPGAEVIALDDSDVDSEIEFFTAKPIRRTAKKRQAPSRVESTPTKHRAPSYDIPSDSEDDSEAERRRKRRRAQARTKQPSLPDWTRSRASQEPRRGSTVESSVAISVISDDEATQNPYRGKGRARETGKRRMRIELTPPPALAEEDRATIEQENQRYFQGIGIGLDDANDANDAIEVGSSSPARDRSGPQVQITVRMVADPDKRQAGREQAVAAYEKQRTFHLFQNDPLSILVQALASRVQVPADQLVLVHEGQRIFSPDKTPKQLGISFTGELKGYELSVYEKIQKAERRARLALFDSEPRQGSDDKERSSARSPSPLRVPSPPAVQKVKLHLRGPKGELHFTAAPTTLVSTILRYYCNKQGVDPSEVERYRLEFDGEHFEGDATVGDMELESGDLIDVSYR